MYERILEILKAKDMTFADLSRATGITENIFSNLKNRDGNLSVKNLSKVALALDVPMDAIALRESVRV